MSSFTGTCRRVAAPIVFLVVLSSHNFTFVSLDVRPVLMAVILKDGLGALLARGPSAGPQFAIRMPARRCVDS